MGSIPNKNLGSGTTLLCKYKLRYFNIALLQIRDKKLGSTKFGKVMQFETVDRQER